MCNLAYNQLQLNSSSNKCVKNDLHTLHNKIKRLPLWLKVHVHVKLIEIFHNIEYLIKRNVTFFFKCKALFSSL